MANIRAIDRQTLERHRWADVEKTKAKTPKNDPRAEPAFGQTFRCRCGQRNGIGIINIYSFCEQILRMTNNKYALRKTDGRWSYDEARTNSIRGASQRRWMATWLSGNPHTIVFCSSCGGRVGTVGRLLRDGKGWRGVEP